jgi:hypothetical protein
MARAGGREVGSSGIYDWGRRSGKNKEKEKEK